MAQVTVWSTEGLAPRRRLEYWNDCACEALTTPMTVDAEDPTRFWGRISHVRLDGVHMAEVSSGAAAVRHSATHAARTDGAFHLLVQLSGRSTYCQGGRESALSPGDFLLVDCGRPYKLVFSECVANLVLTVQRDHLKSYIACPEALASIKLSGTSGPSALTSRFLRELWNRPDDLVAGCGSPFLERALLDLIATAYSDISEHFVRGSSQAMTRRVKLMSFIEHHLCEPDLNAETIAAAFRVTPRCIYRLFDGESESLATYIRRRRLEECARALANPLQQGRSISCIAYDHGFSSIAHFSKVFRQQYGGSPSEYRQKRQGIT